MFLSHSSHDKALVRRVAKDLVQRGIGVWLDEKDIRTGNRIVESLQEGLEVTDALILFLSKSSVASKWVETEWGARLFQDHVDRKSTIITAMVEDCEIPYLLRQQKYVDFRGDYLAGLNSLVLSIGSPQAQSSITIPDYVSELLDDLSSEYIHLPISGAVSLIQTIKTLTRSGKRGRFAGFVPEIPVRTVYDHILSVAHSAECLYEYLSHNTDPSDRFLISECITYHDLNEVLLGDVPAFTNPTIGKSDPSQLYTESRLRSIDSKIRNKVANQFLLMFLSDNQRNTMNIVDEIMYNGHGNVHRYVFMLDKIDPIVSIWRYLHQFRVELSGNSDEFLKRLKNFFENPQLKSIVDLYGWCGVTKKLVNALQDRDLALRYSEDASLLDQDDVLGLPAFVAKRLIEGRPLQFSDSADLPALRTTFQ